MKKLMLCYYFEVGYLSHHNGHVVAILVWNSYVSDLIMHYFTQFQNYISHAYNVMCIYYFSNIMRYDLKMGQ